MRNSAEGKAPSWHDGHATASTCAATTKATMTMRLCEAKEYRDALRARLLFLNAELSGMKRDFILNRIPSGPRRHDAELEKARIERELDRVSVWLHSQAKAEKGLERSDMLSTLIRMLMDAGHGDMVLKAKRASADGSASAAQNLSTFTPNEDIRNELANPTPR